MWQIASATGWSVDYILNRVNYQTLIMMISDAPRFISSRKNKSGSTRTLEEEAGDVVSFFASNLKQ